MNIQHTNDETSGAFRLIENGKEIGELDYIWLDQSTIVINHTEVNSNYEGHGLGKKLVDAAVDYARDNHLKIVPVCPFAKKLMEHGYAYQDVLVEV